MTFMILLIYNGTNAFLTNFFIYIATKHFMVKFFCSVIYEELNTFCPIYSKINLCLDSVTFGDVFS